MTKLLKFEADWCGPCKQQDSLLEGYDATPIEKVDVETDAGSDRARQWEVRSLPTLILLDDGQPVQQWTGLTQVDEIESAVETLNTDTDK